MNEVNPIFQSRRFWVLMVGLVVDVAVYFVGKYLPESLVDVQFVINAITPLVGLLILAYTVESIMAAREQAKVEMYLAGLGAQSDAALQRPYAGMSRKWYCAFVNGDKPNVVCDTAEDLIDHMVVHHQGAWEKATLAYQRRKEMESEDKQTA